MSARSRHSALPNAPFAKKLKYFKMTIAARAHKTPVGVQIKPNEYFRFQVKQTVFKDGSETVYSTYPQARSPSKTQAGQYRHGPKFYEGAQNKGAARAEWWRWGAHQMVERKEDDLVFR